MFFILVETQGFPRHKCLWGNRNDFAALCLQNLLVVEPCNFVAPGSSSHVLTKIKNTQTGVFYFGGDTGIRTLDPMIKSHLLYQLSYVSETKLSVQRSGAILPNKKKKIKKKIRFVKFC